MNVNSLFQLHLTPEVPGTLGNWETWPKTYYQTYCEDPPGTEFSQNFDNAYDCDVAAINYYKDSGEQCLKAGCRFVQE